MKSGSTEPENILLLTLEETSKLVSHSRDPAETLDNIVSLVSSRFKTDVCSVYFLEQEKCELVLAATVGLRKDAIGNIRLKIEEGLVGLVAETLHPVMVENAFTHPRFKYFPDSGEDLFHTFLGVPLVKAGVLIGVLVVQTINPRIFSPDEIRTLVAVASQVATIASDARLLAQLMQATHGNGVGKPLAAKEFTARLLSMGVGLGSAFALDRLEEWRQNAPKTSLGKNQECDRLQKAMEQARFDLISMGKKIAEMVGQDHGAILDAQLMILQDRTIERDLDNKLLEGFSAELALIETLDRYVAAFHRIQSPFFQERVFDVKDVFLRVLWHLRPTRKGSNANDRIILVCREASVMELFSISPEKLAGVIVEKGGPECHAAILARALGIPMVQLGDGFQECLSPGRILMVDGTRSRVIIEPGEEQIHEMPEVGASHDISGQEFSISPNAPKVHVNINLLWEVPAALKLGATGVGLFRSEFMMLARRMVPAEEEQYTLYLKLFKSMNGKPTTIRTFDLRPDKLASFSDIGAAAAKSYDWRMVLESAPLQKLFLEQLRALMRAGVHGQPKIMIPLVGSTETLEFVLKTFEEARNSLAQENREYNPEIPLGLMVETAAAVSLMEFWTPHADFFALGTNDLFSSVTGIDRNDESTSGLCDHCHPGFLRIISQAIEISRNSGRPITACGEMAADPVGTVFLAAQGVESLSVPVPRLASVNRTLASIDWDKARSFTREFPKLHHANQIRGKLSESLDNSYPFKKKTASAEERTRTSTP